MFGRVGFGLRRHVALVSATLLEVDGRADLGELDDVNVVPSGRPLREHLVEQRPGLRPDILALIFGKSLVKPSTTAEAPDSPSWL